MMAAAFQRSKRVRHPKLSPEFVYQLSMASKKNEKLHLTGGTMNSPHSHSQEEQMSGFHELPTEIIFKVLKYLPIKSLVAAGGVCKKWRKFCKEPLLWKCVSFEGIEVDRLPWNFWKRLEKLGTTCLDLHACVDLMTSAPRKAINYITKLTNINALYFGVIEKTDLSTIIQNMLQLKILHVICLLPSSLESMMGTDGTILYDIGRMGILKDLEELKLGSVYSLCVPVIAFHGGMEALQELKKLKKLVLSNFEGIGDDLCFMRNLQLLEHLELGNCSTFSLFSLLDLSQIENLKTLSLTQAHCMCHEAPCLCIGTYLKRFKKLRKLTLIMCCIPVDLNESLQELPELKSLEIWPYLDVVFIPHVGNKDQERFVNCYLSIFHGLEHLPSITVGILEKSIYGLFNPFGQNDKLLETHFSRFYHAEEEMKEEYYLDKVWEWYNRFLFGSGEEEERMRKDESTGEKQLGASSSKLQGNLQENGGASPTRVKKGKRKGVREKEKKPKMGTYDMIKYGLIDLLPSTRLTFYRVKMSSSGDNANSEIVYISRKEEHFNMPTLSQT